MEETERWGKIPSADIQRQGFLRDIGGPQECWRPKGNGRDIGGGGLFCQGQRRRWGWLWRKVFRSPTVLRRTKGAVFKYRPHDDHSQRGIHAPRRPIKLKKMDADLYWFFNKFLKAALMKYLKKVSYWFYLFFSVRLEAPTFGICVQPPYLG